MSTWPTDKYTKIHIHTHARPRKSTDLTPRPPPTHTKTHRLADRQTPTHARTHTHPRARVRTGFFCRTPSGSSMALITNERPTCASAHGRNDARPRSLAANRHSVRQASSSWTSRRTSHDLAARVVRAPLCAMRDAPVVLWVRRVLIVGCVGALAVFAALAILGVRTVRAGVAA